MLTTYLFWVSGLFITRARYKNDNLGGNKEKIEMRIIMRYFRVHTADIAY